MKKPVLLIIILMSICIACIIGLQLFWNYQNYKSTVRNFDHDINEALDKAVARETDQRRNEVVKRFEGWLADTSLVTITADHNNRNNNTVFYVQDTHPKFKEDKKRKFQFGLSFFTEKLDHITPKAKAIMIRHFGEGILKPDLKNGTIYNYTEMLGDSLNKVFNASKVSIPALHELFSAELAAKSISAGFVLNPAKSRHLYLTKPVNTNFRQPFKNDFVYAGFGSPNTYFFKEMKWVILCSLLLILITICCFSYTLNTLLSQQKLAELKDNFVNNMTHELNTPISSIKITAEALKSFKHSPDIQAEYLNIISYQADKLTGLTSQILETNRSSPNLPGKVIDIDLNKLIGTAISEMRAQIENSGAVISFNSPHASTKITGDGIALTRLITNLIDNALKYTSVTPVIAIELTTNSEHAEITVKDNGIGIPAAYQSHVFDPFFRVPQGDLHNVKGFGLGLSYVRQVVRQHAGSIGLGINKPAGSIFTIKLPLAHE